MDLRKMGLELADEACRVLGMVPAEEHDFSPEYLKREPAHSFWRMSLDGSRLVTVGGDIYLFVFQWGRFSVNVESPAEADFLGRHVKNGDGR